MEVLVPLAPGFEEIEAITIIDVLRRAGLDVIVAGSDTPEVTGSHNITIRSDKMLEDIVHDTFSAIVLPGGMPGSDNLRKDSRILSLLQRTYNSDGVCAAICAAPIALAEAGLLEGKNVSCFPGCESAESGATYSEDPVTVDGRIVTGRGAGCAIPFALKLVELLIDQSTAQALKEKMQVYWM